MSEELKAKLREIIDFHNDIEEALDQIAQAFTEAGYSKLQAWRDDERMLTSQEWYERFEKELRPMFHLLGPDFNYNTVMNAAKRAAGLE